jgi:Glycosyltransferase family 87
LVRGLFVVVGGDWARFWGASRAFESEKPAAAYQLANISAFMQPLAKFVRPGGPGIRVGPAPYPPIFMSLFDVFTEPSPPTGFLLWTAFNVVLAAFVARRIASEFRTQSPWAVTILIIASFPLMMALVAGQVVVLLLVCVSFAVADFEQGREFRAGIWTGLLILKPQYAIGLVLVYLIKRRTAAASGFAVGAAAIVIGSLAAGGVSGLIAYGRMLMTSYPSLTGGAGIDPNGMIGWRDLVLTTFPHLAAGPSLILVAAMSLMTLALLPLIWRGEWNPSDPRFAAQMTATFAVTLLVAYHSQPHGAALLLLPGGLVVARQCASPGVRKLLVGAIAGAPILGAISALAVGDLSLVGLGTTGVLIALLIMLAYEELAKGRGSGLAIAHA